MSSPAPHEKPPKPAPEKQKAEPRPAEGAQQKSPERKPLDLRVRTVRNEHDASGGH